jgi:hypothetical protein
MASPTNEVTSATQSIIERRRLTAPAPTPQALAWHAGALWLGSRDRRMLYVIDPESWKVRQEITPPGIPWAAVSTGDGLRMTIGEGADDDRYVYRVTPEGGFSNRFACPDFTGSYLSYDGEHLYLSQWYKQRILQLSEKGDIVRAISVGGEISGHTYLEGMIYVLRGTEADSESWHIARLDPRQDNPEVEDLASIPFACGSLAFDGAQFWTNHREASETVAFVLPER